MDFVVTICRTIYHNGKYAHTTEEEVVVHDAEDEQRARGMVRLRLSTTTRATGLTIEASDEWIESVTEYNPAVSP